MRHIGDKVKVIAATGAHSKLYLGRTGRTAMRLSATGQVCWVVLFSAGPFGCEEGLYRESELEWRENEGRKPGKHD